MEKKNILVIIGSASDKSTNHFIVKHLVNQAVDDLVCMVFSDLKKLPAFNPELSEVNPPIEIIQMRNSVDRSDGVIICTPEYIYSLPSGLKNLFEWCVASTVFNGKPVGLLSASTLGRNGHAELMLIMKTLQASFTTDTTLLIQGVKGKLDQFG